MKSFEIELGKKKITFEVKNWAKKANGEVLVSCGETQVLVTAVMGKETDRGYFPLMVNYEEKYYARGEILGSRYLRREGKPSNNAVLIARLIDRTIRPLFPKGMKKEVQVIATCLAWDGENDPDILSILGASFALAVSNIPWKGPVGALRIAIKDNKPLINPTYKEREEAEMELTLCGLKDKENKEKTLINMIELEGWEVKEQKIVGATKKAIPHIKNICSLLGKAREEIGEEKLKLNLERDEELAKEVERFAKEKMEKLLFESSLPSQEKLEKLNELKEETAEHIKELYPEEEQREKVNEAKEIFEENLDPIIHEKGVKGERMDGRAPDEIREIECTADPVKHTHGSGIFARGITTSLSVLTLGGPQKQKLIEGMEIDTKKRFLHHYNFPPYSAGEVSFLRAPGRREIGHGMLGEKTLEKIIPDFDKFPYTIRLVSEILASSGSTSMAAICSSSIALMDAGVPIKRPAAGIAVGLVEHEGEQKLLTDIQGPEDFHGGMDFKVGGTKKGVNAIQMDVKVKGIDIEILEQALKKARKARLKVLEKIKEAIEEPRPHLSPSAPKVIKTTVPKEKIGKVIGSGGKTIRKIGEKTESEIDIEDNGDIYISSTKLANAQKALTYINQITKELKPGDTFAGEVSKTLPFGVIVDLCPGKDGLLHKSRYKKKLKEGDTVEVKVVRVDKTGKVDLALKKSSQTKRNDSSRGKRRRK